MSMEDKMQQFIPGIVDLDDDGPELFYYVSPEGEVTTLVRFPDGSQAWGEDKAGTLASLLGQKPSAGWYTSSGDPVSPPLGA
jgi:hypothetical protein